MRSLTVQALPKTDHVGRTLLDATRRRWDVLVLLAVMAVTNGALLFGGNTDFWALYPQEVARGQWWRLITNDYAHSSLRHLLALGLAFWVLYFLLKDPRPLCRLAYIFLSGAGSTLFEVLFESEANLVGLRGLSGVIHGVLAVCALEMLLSTGVSRYRIVGGTVLLLVIVKLAIEFATGRPLLTPLYLGHVSSPAVPCHVGGLLGGVLAFTCLRKSRGTSTQSQ
jgi:rhomboid family GlyGly-CTERM serine protease